MEKKLSHIDKQEEIDLEEKRELQEKFRLTQKKRITLKNVKSKKIISQNQDSQQNKNSQNTIQKEDAKNQNQIKNQSQIKIQSQSQSQNQNQNVQSLIDPELYNQQQLQQQFKKRKKKKLDAKQDKALLEKLKVPIYSPRSTYQQIREKDDLLLQELIFFLEPFTVSVLANDFEELGSEVDKIQFINLMKFHLKDWQVGIPNREYKLIRTLDSFFDQMDINNNGSLDWEELSNYVLGKATIIDNVKTRGQIVKYYTKNKHFSLQSKFNSSIAKIIYIESIDRVAFFQKGTDVIMFLGSDGHSISKPLKIQPKDIIIDILNVKKQHNGIIQMDKKDTAISRTTIIIDMIYIKEYNILIVSSNDRYLRGYRYISNGFIQANFPKSNELFEKVIQKTEVSCLKWDEHKKILCCGLDNGNILLWDLASEFEETNNFNSHNNKKSSQINSNSKQNTLQQIQTSTQDLSINNKNLKQNKLYVEPQNNVQQELLFAKNKQYILEGGHKAVIQDIVPMPKLHYLATAGLDGNIVLWETINYKKKRIYTEHNRGIISLAFNPQTILLFSAGFDHWIGVWNPYTDHLINKITGYLAPIYKLEVILSHQQLVSLDCEGNILIRDLNKFNVNQSIQLEHPDEKHRFEAQTFCTVEDPLKLYFAGNNLQMYQYDVNFNPTHTDDNYPLNCLAVNQQLLLYTPCGNIIKVWSLLTGQLTKLFTGLTNKQSKITAFILDKLKKRMLIGDQNGYISIFNAENGAKIKNLPKHQKTVFHILENQSAKIIVSASIDDQIYITLDNSFGENELLRVISLKDSHIKNITFYQDYKFVIVGTSIGQVAFFESVSGKYHGQSEANQFRDQITSLTMIKNLPFLISTSSSGRINFIASPPLLYKYKIVDSFQNLDSEDQFEAVGITHASYCHENKYLFITDEKLQIKLFDISNIYDNIFQNVQEVLNLKKQDQFSYLSSLKQFNNPINPKFIQPVWTIKQAHMESIISLNYEHQEKLLFTTSTDKKVKIWCSQTGKYQGSLQQNHEYIPPQQLAYRKKFTEEIYDNDGEIFEKRIDKNFMNHKESFQISESNAEEKKLFQSELLRSEENNNNDLGIVNYQDKILQQNQNQDIKNQLKQFLHENSFNTQSQKSQNLDLSQEDNYSILDQDDISQSQLNKIKLQKIQVDSSQNTEQLNLSEMSQQNINSSNSNIDTITTNEQENQSKIQRTQSNNYEDNISKREVLSQEAEFNPYYFLNIIHPDKKPNNLISNPDWNINIDFDKMIAEKEDRLKAQQEILQKIENGNQILEFENRKFHIVNFEVNPKKFDPNNQFRPIVQSQYNKKLENSKEQTVQNSILQKQNMVEIHQKRKQIKEESIDNLYKYKMSMRNINPWLFKDKVNRSKKLSDITKQKLFEFLHKLDEYKSEEEEQQLTIQKQKQHLKLPQLRLNNKQQQDVNNSNNSGNKFLKMQSNIIQENEQKNRKYSENITNQNNQTLQKQFSVNTVTVNNSKFFNNRKSRSSSNQQSKHNFQILNNKHSSSLQKKNSTSQLSQVTKKHVTYQQNIQSQQQSQQSQQQQNLQNMHQLSQLSYSVKENYLNSIQSSQENVIIKKSLTPKKKYIQPFSLKQFRSKLPILNKNYYSNLNQSVNQVTKQNNNNNNIYKSDNSPKQQQNFKSPKNGKKDSLQNKKQEQLISQFQFEPDSMNVSQFGNNQQIKISQMINNAFNDNNISNNNSKYLFDQILHKNIQNTMAQQNDQ